MRTYIVSQKDVSKMKATPEFNEEFKAMAAKQCKTMLSNEVTMPYETTLSKLILRKLASIQEKPD